MRNLLKLFALILAASLSTPALAVWHKAESRNFVIYGDMPAEDLRREALRLEGFDRLLRLRFGVTGEDRQYPLTIYITEKLDTVRTMAGNDYIAGFYRPGRFGSFALTSREKPRSRVEGPVEDILLHEYAHHFQLRHIAAPRPPWYVEGFAQYFATAQLSPANEWTVGKPANNRGIALNARFEMPVRQMLTENMENLDGRERGALYARAWILTHYLNAAPQRQAQLAAYLAALGRGEARLAAAESAFGDLAALERALDTYKHAKLVSVTYDSFGTYTGPLTITALDARAARLVTPSLMRRSGKQLDRARSELEALTAEAPGYAEAWFELALVLREMAFDAADSALRLAGLAASEAAADKALVANPDHVRANVLKADYRLRALATAKETDPAKWRDARAFLLRANAADPDDPAPMFAWFESFQRMGRTPSPTAHDGLARAFAMQPEVPDLRLAYAYDVARLGQHDKALALVEVIAADPHRAGAAVAAFRRLAALKRGEVPPSDPAP